MKPKRERPVAATNKHLEFLDDLRESGVTNMWGASAYLEKRFKMDDKTAIDVLGYWMDTFAERHGLEGK